MAKPDQMSAPATMSGRVIARLNDVEAWFRSGYRTQEVLDMLARDGIKLHKVKFRQLLARYGKSESAVRRAIAAEAGLATPEPGPKIKAPPAPSVSSAVKSKPRTAEVSASGSDIAEQLRRKDGNRVEFRPNPAPRDEDLY